MLRASRKIWPLKVYSSKEGMHAHAMRMAQSVVVSRERRERALGINQGDDL